MKTLILGGPGAGKTTYLLDVLEKELDNGIRPERIAFVSFTKKAISEAKDRIKTRFHLSNKRTLYFRTLHSLCFLEAGLRRDGVLSRQHWKKIGQLLGVRITGFTEIGEDISALGDRMIFLDNLARATKKSLSSVWHDSNIDVSWLQLEQFVATVNRYKDEYGLVDFTDMLTDFIAHGSPLPVDVAFIDEAQDLSPLQWDVVHLAFAKCKRIYYAGDDDQAIYTWSGADIEQFLSLKHDEQILLRKSHRLPKLNLEYAKMLSDKIQKRYIKDWVPRGDGGVVRVNVEPSQLNLANGDWLLLARNACFLKMFETACIELGVVYVCRKRLSVDPEDVIAIRAYETHVKSGRPINDEVGEIVARALNVESPRDISYSGIWHDAFDGFPQDKIAYYLNVLRNKRRLSAEPRIIIDTIHAVKGGEATSVAIATDITSAVENNLMRKPDDEYRVLYVGATRAKEKLFIMNAKTSTSVAFPMPL